ncbi:MAG: VWA domain-containing protein [Deltaproteobacteria bacterium]|jgi:uncharacterized protein YegL|nr:VWA domain-containing protein [Deltaproteobacteria bacterium]
MSRRLPVYLLLDCSESMAGKPLEAVEAGVRSMIGTLKKNPYALETAFISVITFDARARTVIPLTELFSVVPPTLSIKPGTALGAALTLLRESIQRDVVRTDHNVQGDWQPLVFILTDGTPTDEWREPADCLKGLASVAATVYAIGCGEEADFTVLNQVADECLHLTELSPESLAKLFVWLSAGVQSMSSTPEKKIDLRKIPLEKGIEEVDRSKPPKKVPTDRFQYLHVMCATHRKYYMLRYLRDHLKGVYSCQDLVKLPADFFSEGTMKSQPVKLGWLHGCLPCPYCENGSWILCNSCKKLSCFEHKSIGNFWTCPFCGKGSIVVAGDGASSMLVEGSQG